MAAEVTVNVHRHTANADPHATGKVTAQSTADAGKLLTFPLPGKVTLPKGEWFATPQIDGDWGEPRLLSIGDQSQTIDLNTYPLARLTARRPVMRLETRPAWPLDWRRGSRWRPPAMPLAPWLALARRAQAPT